MSKRCPRDTVGFRVLRVSRKPDISRLSCILAAAFILFSLSAQAAPNRPRARRGTFLTKQRRSRAQDRRFVSAQAYNHVLRAQMAATIKGRIKELQLAWVYDDRSAYLAESLAKSYFEAEAYRSANTWAQRAVRRDSQNPQLKFFYSRTLLKVDQAEKAARILRQGLRDSPQIGTDALENLRLLSQSAPHLAEKLANYLLGRSSYPAEVWLLKAEALAAQGRLKAASDSLIALSPEARDRFSKEQNTRREQLLNRLAHILGHSSEVSSPPESKPSTWSGPLQIVSTPATIRKELARHAQVLCTKQHVAKSHRIWLLSLLKRKRSAEALLLKQECKNDVSEYSDELSLVANYHDLIGAEHLPQAASPSLWGRWLLSNGGLKKHRRQVARPAPGFSESPQQVEGYQAAVRVFLGKPSPKDGARLKRALWQDAGAWWLHAALGRWYYLRGEADHARNKLQAVVRLSFYEEAWFYQWLAEALQKTGKTQEAEQYFQKAAPMFLAKAEAGLPESKERLSWAQASWPAALQASLDVRIKAALARPNR